MNHLKAPSASYGIPDDQRTEQAAAAVAVAAATKGLSRIDHLEANDDNSKLIAVQGKPGSALSKVVDIATAQAMETPIANSAKALAEVAPKGHEPVRQEHEQGHAHQRAPAHH